MANVMKPATIPLWAGLCVFLLGVSVAAQTPEQARIDALERRVRELESQVRALLAAVPQPPEKVSDVSDTGAASPDAPEVSHTSDTSIGAAQQQPVPSLGPPRAADETSAVS